jgi:cytochrome c556
MLYRRYSNEFSAAVEELLKESEDQDMDGTSLAWVNVTMKCLKCHEWVRGTVIAAEE